MPALWQGSTCFSFEYLSVTVFPARPCQNVMRSSGTKFLRSHPPRGRGTRGWSPPWSHWRSDRRERVGWTRRCGHGIVPSGRPRMASANHAQRLADSCALGKAAATDFLNHSASRSLRHGLLPKVRDRLSLPLTVLMYYSRIRSSFRFDRQGRHPRSGGSVTSIERVGSSSIPVNQDE